MIDELTDELTTSLGVIGLLLLITLVVAAVVYAPFILIWSLNTLFPVLVIPYTIKTWVSAFVLSGMFGRSVRSVRSTAKPKKSSL